MKSPYGWSQDAIDTILIMLKNTQHISSNEPSLIVAKINNAIFKKEVHILGTQEKIAIKQLFQKAGISCPPNQELFPYSNTYLEKLKQLAYIISGDAPKPEPEILEQQTTLQTFYEDWAAKDKLVNTRLPLWHLLSELSAQAPDHPDFEPLKIEIQAIKDNRLLLQQPDLIQPKLDEIVEKLKGILNQLKEKYIAVYDEKMKALKADDYFGKLTSEQARSILLKNQLLTKPIVTPMDAHALLNELYKSSLYTWETKIAALPGQYQAAREDAIKLLAPQATTFSLPKVTISNQTDIDNYITELKTELEEILKNSSSIILK
jgi:hypothetical protein